MAQVSIPSDHEAVRKSKRHSRCTSEEDVIIVREVAAAKAQLAAFGESGRRFEEAANKDDANEVM